jgi:hypothetical protein
MSAVFRRGTIIFLITIGMMALALMGMGYSQLGEQTKTTPSAAA